MKNETSIVYDALLAVPGMSEQVKVDIKISRKQVLLLSNAIRAGMAAKEGMVHDLLSVLPKESGEELGKLADDILEKAGLTDLHNKLKLLA